MHHRCYKRWKATRYYPRLYLVSCTVHVSCRSSRSFRSADEITLASFTFTTLLLSQRDLSFERRDCFFSRHFVLLAVYVASNFSCDVLNRPDVDRGRTLSTDSTGLAILSGEIVKIFRILLTRLARRIKIGCLAKRHREGSDCRNEQCKEKKKKKENDRLARRFCRGTASGIGATAIDFSIRRLEYRMTERRMSPACSTASILNRPAYRVWTLIYNRRPSTDFACRKHGKNLVFSHDRSCSFQTAWLEVEYLRSQCRKPLKDR